MIINIFRASILPSSHYSIQPGAKQLVRQGIESIPPPKQQRRPLPSIPYLSFFYVNNQRRFPIGRRSQTFGPIVICVTACTGHKLLRYNDKVVQWDSSLTRSMDKKDFSLHLSPVTVQVIFHMFSQPNICFKFFLKINIVCGE